MEETTTKVDYKRLSIILAVAFVLLSGYSLFTAFQKNDSVTAERAIPTPKPGTEQLATESKDSFIDEYLASKYTPVYVAYQKVSGDQIPSYAAVFMNKRGWGNDYVLSPYCGTYLQDGNCYVFLEPLPVYGLPKVKLLTTITSEVGAIDWSSLTFKDKEIRFSSGDGDAGVSVQRTWSINIDTGELKKLSEVTHESE